MNNKKWKCDELLILTMIPLIIVCITMGAMLGSAASNTHWSEICTEANNQINNHE